MAQKQPSAVPSETHSAFDVHAISGREGGDGGAGGGAGHSGAKHEYWHSPFTLSIEYGTYPSEHVAGSSKLHTVIPMLASHAQQSPPLEVHLELSPISQSGGGDGAGGCAGDAGQSVEA